VKLQPPHCEVHLDHEPWRLRSGMMLNHSTDELSPLIDFRNTLTLTEILDARFYPRHCSGWDDSLFRHLILSHIRQEDTILDLGAGRGRLEQMNFRGLVKRVCGLDPGETVLTNPHLDEAKVGFAENIPWPNDVFDMVFSDNVIEHLLDPIDSFREVHRVLRPGGLFLVKTPNRYHYVAATASLTPYWFHQWFNARRGNERHDTFPTVYRANTRGRLRKVAESAGLPVVDIIAIEGRPEYMRWTPLTYAFGLLYERIVNSTDLLTPFRVVLLATFRKPK